MCATALKVNSANIKLFLRRGLNPLLPSALCLDALNPEVSSRARVAAHHAFV
jgi:hypothetical protein